MTEYERQRNLNIQQQSLQLTAALPVLHARGCLLLWAQTHLDGPKVLLGSNGGLAGLNIPATENLKMSNEKERWFSAPFMGVLLEWSEPRETAPTPQSKVL